MSKPLILKPLIDCDIICRCICKYLIYQKKKKKSSLVLVKQLKEKEASYFELTVGRDSASVGLFCTAIRIGILP